MSDLSKLKLAVGQIELVDGKPSVNEAALDRMVARALDAGADALVVPYSFDDANDIRLIGLNDTRIDVAGNRVVVDVCGDSYRFGIGQGCEGCDLTISIDTSPYTIKGGTCVDAPSHIVLKPVGMRESGHSVRAYDGGSYATAPDGSVVFKLRDSFEEDFGIVTFNGDVHDEVSQTDKILDCLINTMRRFDAAVLPFEPTWVIGLSGGLDSSVNAALLTLAFGPKRVVGYNMATRYNTGATKSNAAQTAERLAIPLKNGSIEDLVVAMGNTLVQYGYSPEVLGGVVLENVQARTRGQLLSTFAAIEGGVVVNNGNRVECALGYATLYGDAIGALAPIGDLTKVQLFDLARAINERLEVEAVPENLLPRIDGESIEWETMPSAELSSGQVDPMKWFYHDWLISRLQGDEAAGPVGLYDAACDVLGDYLHSRLLDTQVSRWVTAYGLDDPNAFVDDLEWVLASMRRAVFKRIQAPPAIKIASRATVQAFCESQAVPEPPNKYHALVHAVRAMGLMNP